MEVNQSYQKNEEKSMSFYGFLAKHFIPFETARPFGVWLGNVKESMLPEREWLRLFKEFNR